MTAILITGADGFVGRALANRLRTLGHEVEAVDVAVDVTLPLRQPGPYAHVFHLAARTFIPDSWKTPDDFYRVNTLGTVNVLELCRRLGCGITFISSYVYGPPVRVPVDETHPTRPNNPYSHSKLLAEQVCEFYAATLGVAVTILRPFNIYGPGQRRSFLVPTIVAQVIDPSCKAVEVLDLEPRRDLVFVDDVVDALIATMGTAGGVFNVGSGTSVSVAEVVTAALACAGIEKDVRAVGQRRADEILDLYADISKIRSALGWAPRTSLEEGLRRVIDAGLTQWAETPTAGP